MKIIKIMNFHAQFKKSKKPAVAMWGFFDGWHLGHQSLLEQLKKVAVTKKYESVVISFNIKPQVFLQKKTNLILTSYEDKIDFLRKKMIDYYCEIQFNERIAKENENNFISWLKINNIKTIVVNRDIHFGNNGQGGLALLQTSGFEVIICENVVTNSGIVISSTYLKSLLEKGAVKEVNKYLGVKPFCMLAKVEHGIKEGRKLGFPTANLKLLAPYYIPFCGVYVTAVKFKGRYYQAATVIVMRYDQRLVETHLLDFHENIYDEVVIVYFFECIRPYRVFANLKELIARINEDVAVVRQYFKNNDSLIKYTQEHNYD